jgi:hypothetical protein
LILITVRGELQEKLRREREGAHTTGEQVALARGLLKVTLWLEFRFAVK